MADVSDVVLAFVDTTIRYRKATNPALYRRLTGGAWQALRDTFRTYRCIKKERPDVLHLCTSGGLATPKDILILSIARMLGVPGVVHYHIGRLPKIIARQSLDWRLTRRAMLLASSVVVLDKESKSCVEGNLQLQSTLELRNMVEVDRVASLGRLPPLISAVDGHLCVVYVGHVVPAKGIQELVASCAGLQERLLTLDLVGPVSEEFRRSLEKTALTKDSGKWLRFHGKRSHDEAIRCLAQADIFVLPSHTEGMPNVILEAMASGRAIVSTTVGAIPEMLDIGGPQECGICVPPQDVDALTEALERLIDHPDERRALGRLAAQRAKECFDVPVACRQLLELWRAVCKEGG
jgi:glycosyltransferase involved in cell wall biosynthesis